MNIQNYTIKELEDLSKKIRDRILDVVSKNGGHLSSTLGSVELIVAMHHIFDCNKNPFIFDVSHQCYAHKLLTGRWEEFDTVRKFGGISGFCKPSESKEDYFIAGHSSTSVSIAVGAAKAFKIKNQDILPIVMIGDGSMSAGMVYEALNELGDLKLPCLIILNDNEMSIAKPIGAISRYLSRLLAGDFYQSFKSKMEKILKKMPDSAMYLAKKFDESLKLITPGILFEEMGLEYIGPIDGHKLEDIISTINIAKELKKPVIIHAQTLKGKGYEIAEGHHEKWHGVSPFDIKTGEFKKSVSRDSATSIYSKYLLNLADKYDNVVGMTAAMPNGTGLDKLIKKYPNRFFDVAIAEQHAVTSSAAMAKEGFVPFVTIYSTFLQRAYDQIIHDVCIMNLPVVFAIDRAGIVGEDGETHQGVFDISYLRLIPNIVIFAPFNNSGLKSTLEFAYKLESPCAFRYPRGAFILEDEFEVSSFKLGKSQMLQKTNSDILLIGYGNGVGKAYEISKLLKQEVSILDLRFIKPLDRVNLKKYAREYSDWIVISESAKIGGVFSCLSEFLMEENIRDVKIESFEYNDEFITHGKKELVEEDLNLDIKSIATTINRRFK
jgi:1-deoxy-D-xylulose-5-phosphate synthase